MFRWAPIALVALLFSACGHGGTVDPDSAKNLVSVKYGTFFGKCVGYCVTEMTVDTTTATLLRTSNNNSKFPDMTERQPVSSDDWDQLVALANMDAITPLDSVIGCPDCADGGGEWIEVRRGDRVKRVVFENGATIPAINDIVTKTRAIRRKFKD